MAEIFLKAPVGGRNFKVFVLNGNIAGHFVKKLLIPLLGGAELFLQAFDFGNIDGDFNNEIQLPVSVFDRRGMNDDRCFGSV